MATMKVGRFAKVLSILAAAGIGCAGTMTAAATGRTSAAGAFYVAELYPLNAGIAGSDTTGTARITVRGDVLTITIDVKGAPPDIEHWQHFHGFNDERVAACPTAAADANHDGVIDLIETEATSGTTMVPFNGAAAAMQIPTETYPKASAKGSYRYKKIISLKALQAAFAKTFNGQDLDLDHRIIFIHGVPPTTKLPTSVASLGSIPASVTLLIACGKIERAVR
jgi:hypothetical protein